MEDDLAAQLIALELACKTHSPAKTQPHRRTPLRRLPRIRTSGRVWDRPAILARARDRDPYQITSEDFKCQRLSTDLALLTYTASTSARKTLRSSLWRLEADRWRLFFHQGTVIPPA